MSSPWDSITETPRFVLTADQEWSPEWAIEALLDWTFDRQVPLHVFRTSASPVLDDALARNLITQGWHPNFSADSSQGSSTREVIEYMRQHFPDCTSVRGHRFNESFPAWTALAATGIRFDSHFASAFSAHLMPMIHATGIVRLPVYLEDDIWLDAFPEVFTIEPVAATLFRPGLKILNVHPAYVALNVPSSDFFNARRSDFYSAGAAGESFKGEGIRTLLDTLVDGAESSGHPFIPFGRLCEEVDLVISDEPELIPGTIRSHS
jgi:hypothetical protein